MNINSTHIHRYIALCAVSLPDSILYRRRKKKGEWLVIWVIRSISTYVVCCMYGIFVQTLVGITRCKFFNERRKKYEFAHSSQMLWWVVIFSKRARIEHEEHSEWTEEENSIAQRGKVSSDSAIQFVNLELLPFHIQAKYTLIFNSRNKHSRIFFVCISLLLLLLSFSIHLPTSTQR